ncbi:type II toxin-antitoxin system SpoIISA family toxin [Rossellomorea vietnamensis]|uniref:type II toxin-antitoxin system SpoIISA family toxin n=1 Tax=Rossellomorea vietnamensis TaxID=218284 RepID=UPI003CE714EE
MKDVLSRIERLNSFDIDTERDAYLESLLQSEIISVIKENSMIVPVSMNERTMLVVLKNDKGELLEVDAVHITNLIYLFYLLY